MEYIKLKSLIKESSILGPNWEQEVEKRRQGFDVSDNEVKMDDLEFLKRWWHKSILEIDKAIEDITASKERNKNILKRTRGTMFSQIYRKFDALASDKLKYLNYIKKSKTKDPVFVPDHYK